MIRESTRLSQSMWPGVAEFLAAQAEQLAAERDGISVIFQRFEEIVTGTASRCTCRGPSRICRA